MLILLSSTRRKRYRDDVLRCLAAPAGTRIQFRYTEDIVESQIWAHPERYTGRHGLVCSIDLGQVGGPCPIVALRKVTVEAIHKAGATAVVVLVMDQFALAPDVNKFTTEVHTKSGNKVPVKDSPDTYANSDKGRLFFEVPNGVGEVQFGTKVEFWQRITQTLIGQPGYEHEQFFWTVVGLYKSSSVPTGELPELVRWDESIVPRTEYTLLVHVYHPRTDKHDPATSFLRLTSAPEVSTSYPLDLTIDSPYDVKRWRFSFADPSGHSDQRGWLRIGASGSADKIHAPEWEIDLPVHVQYPWGRLVIRSLVQGVLLAVPGATAIFLNQHLTYESKMMGFSLAFAAGLGAATIANFGIK